jgi:hypothetical protein
MVVGMDLFTEHFESHTSQYILIGGAACDRHFEKIGLPFRTTKDLDIILVVEALTPEFVEHFWEFINAGDYTIGQRGDKKQYYRFEKPQAHGYPRMLELFCRKPDTITIPEGFHLTDITTGEEASSLSAILLDDDYYNFTLANTIVSEGLHHANDVALIVLKAKAFINNLARKNEGQNVNNEDIEKHWKDVIRLTVAIDPKKKIDIPNAIKEDLRSYIQIVREENPDVKKLLKNIGAGDSSLEDIFEQLIASFQLSQIL